MTKLGLAASIELSVAEPHRGAEINSRDVYEMWVEAGEESLSHSIVRSSIHRQAGDSAIPLGSDEYFYTSL